MKTLARAPQQQSSILTPHPGLSAGCGLGRSAANDCFLAGKRGNHEWWEHLDWNLDGLSDH